VERTTVIKVGGNELDDPTFLAGLSEAVARFEGPMLLVHGGGKEISAALDRESLPVEFVEGLRVTSPHAMEVMQRVVCGTINKRVVASLVGVVTEVDAPALRLMLSLGWLPVFAPVALGADDGLSYNVNADMVAQAIAGAIGGAELLFVTNVPGVLLEGAVAPQLDRAAALGAIGSGAISGGMVPKVRAALDALDAGAASARITNLAGFADGGTRILN
jgi:acetylglutamate kinase